MQVEKLKTPSPSSVDSPPSVLHSFTLNGKLSLSLTQQFNNHINYTHKLDYKDVWEQENVLYDNITTLNSQQEYYPTLRHASLHYLGGLSGTWESQLKFLK